MTKVAQFQLWDKTSPIITSEGMVISADTFIENHPAMASEDYYTVVSNSITNGSFLGELSRMVIDYTNQGYDFSEATTPEKQLEVINFGEPVKEEEDESNPWERVAAALELANVLSMEDVNPDPDDEEEAE